MGSIGALFTVATWTKATERISLLVNTVIELSPLGGVVDLGDRFWILSITLSAFGSQMLVSEMS